MATLQPTIQAPAQAPGAGLDPILVDLAKSIRQVESGGNFTLPGKSGEFGAYQFMPDTWKATAPKFGVTVSLNKATPEQQNKVAYKQLEEWKQQHPEWNVGNFASAWNAGPGKPDAYLQNHTGTNSKGVSYDTPAYAKNVATNYQQFKAQRLQSAGQTSPNGGTPQPTSLLGTVKKAVSDAYAPVDQYLSDTSGGGLLDYAKAGIYNAGKGLLTLGKDAVVDTLRGINHPIDTAGKTLGFAANELTGKPTENLDSVGQLVQSTIGSKGLLGVAQMPGKVAYQAMHPDENIITPSQALGTSLNAGLSALTFGSGSVAEQGIKQAVEKGLLSKETAAVLAKASTSLIGRSTESGVLGAGFNAAGALNENQPVTGDTLATGFATGFALPSEIKAGGTVFGKTVGRIIPSSSSISDSASQLVKAIGFRGGNKAEFEQFKAAVPVIAEDLKSNGFKITDSSDPNNLINLQKAVDDGQQTLWNKVTESIRKSGGDVAQIDGSVVANEIRKIVSENPKMFLERPELADKIESIAQKYEGKKFTPNEAQAFIKSANKTFDFGNPDVAFQNLINDKVTKSLSPALDKLVQQYDGKGVAGLKRKWSAYKTFSDQLSKKVMMEERKSPVDLGTRINVPEAFGKVAEGIANPRGLLGKVAGGSAQWVVNKLMGERNNVNYRIYKAFNGNPMSTGIISILNKLKTPASISKFLSENPLVQHIIERVYGVKNTPEENVKTSAPISKSKPLELPAGTEKAVEGTKVVNVKAINMPERSQTTVDATERSNSKIKSPQDNRPAFGRKELPAGKSGVVDGKKIIPQNGPTIAPTAPTTYESRAQQSRSYSFNPKNKSMYERANGGKSTELIKDKQTGKYVPRKTNFGNK